MKVQKCSHVRCNVVVKMLITNISQDVNLGIVEAGVVVGINEGCNWIIGDRFFWWHAQRFRQVLRFRGVVKPIV